MKKSLTKKLLIALSALLLVGVLVFCVACDPYAGNYKEVSDDDREAFAAKTSEKLEKIADEKMDNIKMTYNVTESGERNGVKVSNKIKITLTVDGDNMLIEMTMDSTSGSDKVKFESKIWVDGKSNDVYYQIKVDGKTQKGKYSGSETSSELSTALQYAGQMPSMAASLLREIVSSLSDEDVKVYADGDNFKLVEESEQSKSESYFIFEKNGGFKCKIEMKRTTDYDTTKITTNVTAELVSSSDKVKMPNFD